MRLIIVALGLLAASCGNNTLAVGDGGPGDDNSGRPDHVIAPYEVVPISPEFGPGAPAAINAARIVGDGSLQVLVEGFSCAVPTKIDVDESGDAVVVGVSAAHYAQGPCPANIVPWYIKVPTEAPLGNRELQTTDGSAVRVSDCRTDPGNPRCHE
jgi:hypothetical protein